MENETSEERRMAQRDPFANKPTPAPSTEPVQQPRAGERASSQDGGDQEAMHSRRRRVEEGAYYRAERRGFAPGADLDDWYAAEAEEDERDGKAADRTQSEGSERGGGSRSSGG
jgi:hypothetical protein